jgi:hypothetical protein
MCYSHYRQEEMAIDALEKLKSIAEDANEYNLLI